MKNAIKIHIITCVMLAVMYFNNKVYPCHFMGNEITYTCVGHDSFLVMLTFYYDCNSCGMGGTSVNAKCATTGANIRTLSCAKPASIDITGVCQSSCTRCINSSCSFPYGFSKYIYTFLFDLNTDGSCCEILFSYTECCRNSTITTGAANQNAYLEARLNKCIGYNNSSPKFIVDPSILLIVNRDYSLSFLAFDNDTDINGSPLDSLSYEIVQPLQSATSSVSYTGSYSYDKPFYFWGFPNKSIAHPKGFHFNSNTGILSFRPAKIEQTVMAVKVIEWRKINGVVTKIGEITRDIHFIVITNPGGSNPVINTTLIKHLCAGDSLILPVYTSDADAKDSLTISAHHLPPGAVWVDNNGTAKRPTGTIYWRAKEKLISNQPYNVLINVKDNGCPVYGHTSQVVSIYVHPLPSAKINIQKLTCNQYRLIANELTEVNSLKWIFNGKDISTNDTTEIEIKKAGTYPIKLEIKSAYCTSYIYDTLFVPTFLSASLPSDTILCKGSSLNISPQILDSQGIVNYLWSTGDTTPFIHLNSLTRDIQIILKASDSMFCSSDTLLIKVDQFDVVISQGKTVCPGFPSILSATPVFDEGKQVVSYQWLDLSCNCPKGNSDSLTIYNSGVLCCKIVDEFGCSATDTISSIYHKNPEITILPIPFKCLNEKDFNLDSFASPSGGIWYALDSNLITSNTFHISLAKQGQNLLFYQFTDTFTTCTNTDKTTLLIKKHPEISVIKPFIFCDENKLIDLSDYVSPPKGFWDTSHSAIINFHFFNPSIAASDSLPITYLVIDTNACYNIHPISYSIYPLPHADFSSDKINGLPPLSVQFVNLSSIDSGAMLFLWDFGDGDTSSLKNPSHLYSDTGHYSVNLKVTSDFGCSDSLKKDKLIRVYAVSIPENESNEIKVYPNPAQDKIIVNFSYQNIGEIEIVLLNSLGIKIREINMHDSQSAIIERENLPSGLYILKITGENGLNSEYKLIFE